MCQLQVKIDQRRAMSFDRLFLSQPTPNDQFVLTVSIRRLSTQVVLCCFYGTELPILC